MTLFYIDTNIWLDFLLERKDKYKDLGEIASKFFYRILQEQDRIIISPKLFEELINQLPEQELNSIIKPFEKLLFKVHETEELNKLAKSISKKRDLPKADALYALIAKENNAIVISRDKHFKQLSDICIFKRPEEII